MANQDILFNLWVQSGRRTQSVSLNEIEQFAKQSKMNFQSKNGSTSITPSGINYAVLMFIIQYCQPINWPDGVWNDFEKNRHSGNYGVWRQYLNQLVNIDTRSESVAVDVSLKLNPPFPDFTMSKFDHYIDWFVKTIDEFQAPKGKGWLGLLLSYQWPKGKGNFDEGMYLRIAFHYLVNHSADATGRGAEEYRKGMYNAIAGWGGIEDPVDVPMAKALHKTILYLRSVGESLEIDPDQIYGKRVATTSKICYLSNPKLWTIFDSRVASSLYYMAEKYAQECPNGADKIYDDIQFSIPPSPWKDRKNPAIPWNDNLCAPSFIRASLLLRCIAAKLNETNIPPPHISIFTSGMWELCHVEMVLFMNEIILSNMGRE